ncbi:TIGR00730 family Rossman fold protein [bacterium]|nr:TIGR00730 family Rossman fold protein [bacterium]
MPKSVEEQSGMDQLNLQSSDSITWRIFRIMSEFVSGFQFISQYEKTISIFGSARFESNSRYYKEAFELARKLGQSGFNVVTGGGPGIMEAANKGASDAGVHSIGLNIQLPFEQRINRYVTRGIGFHYFFTRKVMLSAAGQAYVFFPGGFGTLDEFFELVTLIQTKKMERIPVVLYGKDFWRPLDKFIDETVYYDFKGVDKEDMDIYTIVDNVNDAVKLLKKSKSRFDF